MIFKGKEQVIYLDYDPYHRPLTPSPFLAKDTKAQNLGKFFLIIPHLFFAGQTNKLNHSAMINPLFSSPH